MTHNPMILHLEAVVLEGRHVRLEHLDLRHASDLFTAGRDPAMWRYTTSPPWTTVEHARAWIEAALKGLAAGTEVPFAIVHLARGRAIGSTRYLDIRPEHRGVEIGWTWIASEHQGTVVNPECKLLLLDHAFSRQALRVQFKTDARNLRSQRALEKIGATREGVLRKHVRLHDGYIRDSVYFSIIDTEWPAVKARLQARVRQVTP